MKYEIESLAVETIKKSMEENAIKNEDDLIKKKIVKNYEPAFSCINHMLNFINWSHYPEFKGLRLMVDSVNALEDGTNFIKASFKLINEENTIFEVTTNGFDMKLSDKEQNIVIILHSYENIGKTVISEYEVNFVLGNDIVSVYRNKDTNYNIHVDLYTDVVNDKFVREDGKPKELIPDFKTQVIRRKSSEEYFYGETIFSPYVKEKDMKLFDLRLMGMKYAKNCHEKLKQIDYYRTM